ncbi:MAG TPA: hypothetical protein VMF53_08840 [Alphaproteobacteria bacterium]|nr:hypothetical protein [Alphaproteobacteria bacterium]
MASLSWHDPAVAILLLALASPAHATEITVPADGSASFTSPGSVIVAMNAGAKTAELALDCRAPAPEGATPSAPAPQKTRVEPGAAMQFAVDPNSRCDLRVQGGPVSVQY